MFEKILLTYCENNKTTKIIYKKKLLNKNGKKYLAKNYNSENYMWIRENSNNQNNLKIEKFT